MKENRVSLRTKPRKRYIKIKIVFRIRILGGLVVTFVLILKIRGYPPKLAGSISQSLSQPQPLP